MIINLLFNLFTKNINFSKLYLNKILVNSTKNNTYNIFNNIQIVLSIIAIILYLVFKIFLYYFED